MCICLVCADEQGGFKSVQEFIKYDISGVNRNKRLIAAEERLLCHTTLLATDKVAMNNAHI